MKSNVKKIKVKDLIEEVLGSMFRSGRGYPWWMVRKPLEDDEKCMVYHIVLDKVLRVNYLELQEYDPKDGKWHECLEPYNTINTKEDHYKFCKFKEV